MATDVFINTDAPCKQSQVLHSERIQDETCPTTVSSVDSALSPLVGMASKPVVGLASMPCDGSASTPSALSSKSASPVRSSIPNVGLHRPVTGSSSPTMVHVGLASVPSAPCS